MRSILLAILLMIGSVSMHAQYFSPDLTLWDYETLKKIKKASFHPLCNRKSNNVVFYTNMARVDGALFVETVLKPYLELVGDTAFSPYLQSLITTLNSKKNQEPLKHNLWLEMMAKSYATSAGRKGVVGHNRFDQRFQLLISLQKAVGENCSYGKSAPIEVVVQLLIDEDVPNLGHRRNILSNTFKKIGVGFAPHKSFLSINCVQNFSD
jgi:uncharacterized protein YkwD